MMKLNKLILTAVLAATAFVSTSALAVTRSCDGEVVVHVTSTIGKYIGNASVTATAPGSAGGPYFARIKARDKVIDLLYPHLVRPSTYPKALNILTNSPSGNYIVEVKRRVYSNNPDSKGACDSSVNNYYYITK